LVALVTPSIDITVVSGTGNAWVVVPNTSHCCVAGAAILLWETWGTNTYRNTVSTNTRGTIVSSRTITSETGTGTRDTLRAVEE